MTARPDDLLARAREELARLRAAVNDRTHWVFLTDTVRAAQVLNASAAGAIYTEIPVCLVGPRPEVFVVAVLAVSKKAWPRSAALRVATSAAAAGGSTGPNDTRDRIRGGTDVFLLAADEGHLRSVLGRSGTGASGPPARNRGVPVLATPLTTRIPIMDATATVEPAATDLRPLAAFATLPGGRGRTSVRSLTRWIAEGATVQGRTVRLRAERVGGSWRTSAAWIEEFISALTDAATGHKARTTHGGESR